MNYLEINMRNKIVVDNNTVIYWYHEEDTDEYRVVVINYNREIYNKKLDGKHYKIYYHFINERVKYLLGEGILNKKYVMILLDGTMYHALDKEFCHFKELKRILTPIDSIEEFAGVDRLFDLVLDSTIRTGEIYSETDLVYHNGAFYNNGRRIGDIRDFDRDGIDYNKFDLLQGITKQQLEYLVSDYHSRDFTNYITSEVNICIDRWY